MPSSWLATKLDELMLEGKILHPDTIDEEMPLRSGAEVAGEIAGRMLLRYTWDQNEAGRDSPTFVTPTPLSQEEVPHWLNLPNRALPRPWVLLIDPAQVEVVQGPRWCSMGQGIEYLLPHGYADEAIYGRPWVVEIR